MILLCRRPLYTPAETGEYAESTLLPEKQTAMAVPETLRLWPYQQNRLSE